MSFEINRREARRRRQVSGRRKVRGTSERPRLCVFRSARHIYLQVIDDDAGRTLVSASTMEPAIRQSVASPATIAAATAVGKLIAERAKAADVAQVVFDRAGFPYHGRVKAVAEAAREGGLDF
ncbi:MAG: 50S ribosomal protein L18 [Armatimonadetes bacterium]|nr:50S ribosomal protein L18 [Armatimonadota bacterium]